jgi:hypothetical protein
LTSRNRKSGGHRNRALLAAIVTIGFGLSASPASAQNFFESLFGRVSPHGGNAYADPNQQFNPFGQRQEPRVETGNAVAFCVRTCDGRYFPIQKISGATPAQTCSSFCPASQTKIYRGSTIDHSVGPEGRRYTELSTAFTYREKIVAGCTCNGKDAFGLVTPSVENDTTLRAGDIVATNSGMMAYNGPAGRQNVAEFTPIESYQGVAPDVRQRLAETRITPSAAGATPVRIVPAPETTASINASRAKRAQAAPPPQQQQGWRPWFWR